MDEWIPDLSNPVRLHRRSVIDVVTRTLDALQEAGKLEGQSTELTAEIAGVVIGRLVQEDRIILHTPDDRQTHISVRERLAEKRATVDPSPGEERTGGPEIIMRVEDSVTDDLIYCLFDGVGRKMITRHILAKYNMTWPQYLAYCNLPADYPRVAPNYSDEHSKSVARVMNGPDADPDKARTRRTEAVLRKKRRLAETPAFGLTSEQQRQSDEKQVAD